MEIRLIIAKKMKELRQDSQLTQNKISQILGVNRVSYNRYENNEREIPIEILCKLADYYEVSLDYLVGRED